MLSGNPIVVQGFEIPSDNLYFLILLSIHIFAGLTCVLTGAMAMLAKKQAGLHPKAGSIYYYSLWVVLVTVTVIAIMRWKEDYHLLILGVISFVFAFVGRKARKDRWQKWSVTHISCMGASYIFLLTAFYVDNGRFLPVWKNLPALVYWLLPALIGFPIIIRILLIHPLSKKYFQRN